MALEYGVNAFNEKGETFDNYEPQNESQRIAFEGLKKLTDLIIENKGNLGEAAIIGLDGKPGLGKSHLLNAIKEKLKKSSIEFVFNVDKHLLLSNINYKGHKIVIIDDLFQDKLDFSDISNYDLKKIKELIFEIYESKAILFVSSNFDIKEILNKVGTIDARIESRIKELLGHTMPIRLEGNDYREEKAKKKSQITSIFDVVKKAVPNK